MFNNGMNYSMYNTLSYPQLVQQQSFYEQQFSNTLSQSSIPQYGGNYQMYSSMQNQSQYNNYNHLIQSTAETLAAFTHPSESSTKINNLPSRKSQQNLNRRTINHSSNNTNSTSNYYCQICRIACGSHTSYQAHLNGIKHKKKENISQNQQNNQNIFRCELCDINCTSSDAYKAHLDGNKHDKTTKLHRKLGKTIPENTNQSSIPINESQAIINNDEKELIKNNVKFIGIEYIETSYDDTNIPKSYHCKLCDCKFNDSNTKDAHLKGKRHLISYKKKVDPNFQVDNNKTSNLKQRLNKKTENINNQQINNNNQTDIDDDTKYLMNLHQQIIPTQNLLDTVEQFVSAVEAALKSCSNQLHPSQLSSPDDNSGTVDNKSPLMGVSRVGILVKNLMIKSDRLFHIVVICTEWPTMNLFEKVFSILYENFHETWKNQITIQCQKENEIIQVYTNTIEGEMSVFISFTSLSIQQENLTHSSEQLLTEVNCFKYLNAMHSVRWFQNQVSTRQYASALIRCLRYKTNISLNWQALSSEAIEILVEYTLSKTLSPLTAFRRVLEYLSGGLILSNGPGLRVPWQSDLIIDVFDNLNTQQRNDITREAQLGLRLMAFGQLNKWLEQYDIPQVMKSFQKRSYFDEENEVSKKRQCLKSENIDEK